MSRPSSSVTPHSPGPRRAASRTGSSSSPASGAAKPWSRRPQPCQIRTAPVATGDVPLEAHGVCPDQPPRASDPPGVMQQADSQLLAHRVAPENDAFHGEHTRTHGARSAENERRKRAPSNRMVSCASHSHHELRAGRQRYRALHRRCARQCAVELLGSLRGECRACVGADIEFHARAIPAGQAAGRGEQHGLQRLTGLNVRKQQAAWCALIQIAQATGAGAVTANAQDGGAVSALVPHGCRN